MKRNFFLSASAIILLLAMNSCKTAVVEPDAPLQFSTQTVEQQKASIEQSGLDFADKMNGMKETQAMKVIDFLTGGQMGLNAPALVAPLRNLRASLIKNDVNGLDNFNKQMRSAAIPDSVWGTYTFNPNNDNYEFVEGVKNTAIIKFYADSISTTTNGTITISYAESTVAIPDMELNYPKSISAVLKVNNIEALNAQFAGEYLSDGTPTSIVQTLAIGAYNWSSTMTNKSTEVSANFSFKYNTQVLLKYDMGATGSFTATQIENAVDLDVPENVITGGFMSFQVMNVAVYGGITDVKGFMNEAKALKQDSVIQKDQLGNSVLTEYFYPKTEIDKEAVIFNKYLKFYGYFVDPKEKFAEVELYTAEKLGPTLVYIQTSTNWSPNPPSTLKFDVYDVDYKYNSTTGNYDCIFKFYTRDTKIEYYSQPRLVLSDGSKITDFDKYATDNFGKVRDKFESMLTK